MLPTCHPYGIYGKTGIVFYLNVIPTGFMERGDVIY